MLYKNLAVKELYASIPATSIIAQLFETGLEVGSTQLAVSAMEELMIRGDTDIIATKLQSAADKGQFKLGTSIAGMIARSLIDFREDAILHKYGKAVLNGEGTEGPLAWLSSDGAAKYFAKTKMGELLQDCSFKDMDKPAPPRAINLHEEVIQEAIREVFQPHGFD